MICSYQTGAIDNSITGEIGFLTTLFDYKEFKKNGQLFNHEYGTLPGFKIGLRKDFNQSFLATTFSFLTNSVSYAGESQLGIPVKTRTNEKILNFSFQLGQQLPVISGLETQFYTGVGYYRWRRNILPTPTQLGLLEIYQWWYGLLGITNAWPINDKSMLRLNFTLTHPINPTIKVNFNNIFDEKTFDLVERWGKNYAIAWQYQYNQHIKIIFEPYFEQWHFAQSEHQTLTQDGKVVGGLFEPQSRMHNRGLVIYLRYTF